MLALNRLKPGTRSLLYTDTSTPLLHSVSVQLNIRMLIFFKHQTFNSC